jgi:microcystin-dependent protein
MTESSEFYGQTATDPRLYYGVDIASFFRTQLISGVVKGKFNELVVSQHTSPNMSVDVASGQGWVYGYFVKSDEVETKTIDANTSGQLRIDRIILRNAITGAKTITIEVLKGTPGAGAPGLTTDATTYEVSLAQVSVANGASQILNANITDERTWVTLKNIRQEAFVANQDIDLGTHKIISLLDGTVGSDLMSKGQFDTQATFYGVPPGAILNFGNATVPTGFLLCDGAAVSRTTYAALFAAIGTVFGVGDGTTTFNLPNAIGKVIIGLDPDDADFNTLGNTGGVATVTLDTTMIPSHTHTNGTYDSGSAENLGNINVLPHGIPSGGTTGSTGGGGAHENMPPYVKASVGIKT